MASFLLSTAVAKKAVEMAAPSILAAMENGTFKRSDMHIVIMNPGIRPWEVESPEEAILYEHSFGDPAKWEHSYDEIARSKAFISWRTGLPSHLVNATRPYLLRAPHDLPDTRYFGSAVLEGMVVAASGIQAYFDESTSYCVAANCRALAIQAMKNDIEPSERTFLYEPALDDNSDSR